MRVQYLKNNNVRFGTFIKKYLWILLYFQIAKFLRQNRWRKSIKVIYVNSTFILWNKILSRFHSSPQYTNISYLIEYLSLDFEYIFEAVILHEIRCGNCTINYGFKPQSPQFEAWWNLLEQNLPFAISAEKYWQSS